MTSESMKKPSSWLGSKPDAVVSDKSGFLILSQPQNPTSTSIFSGLFNIQLSIGTCQLIAVFI